MSAQQQTAEARERALAAMGRMVSLVLSNASGIFATGFLVLLAAIFMLLEAPSLRGMRSLGR